MVNGKITLQEELEMWHFLLQNTENFGTTGLWKQFKLVNGTSRNIQSLYNRFKYIMSPKLHTMDFSVDEKARLYKQYKIEVDPSYRDTLTEHGYKIDEQGFVVDEPEPAAEPAPDVSTAAPKNAKKRHGSSIRTTSRKKPRTRKSAGSEAASQEPASSRARQSREAPPPRAPRAPRPVREAVEPAPAPVEAPSTRRSSRAHGAVSSVVKLEPVEHVEPVELVEPVEPQSVEPIVVEPRASRSRARASGAPAPALVNVPAPVPAHIELDSVTAAVIPAVPVVSEPAAQIPHVNARREMFARRCSEYYERRRMEHLNQMSVKKILKTLEPLAERAHKSRIEIALKQLKNKDQKVSTENVRSVIDSALNILNV